MSGRTLIRLPLSLSLSLSLSHSVTGHKHTAHAPHLPSAPCHYHSLSLLSFTTLPSTPIYYNKIRRKKKRRKKKKKKEKKR